MVTNTKKYRNESIINEVEAVADKILKEKASNKYRDHFFPRMCKELGYKIGAEIGVDKGGFSNHMLSKSDLEMYYCIDPWIDNFGSGHLEGYFDPNGGNRKQECADQLQEFIDAERVELVQATGLEVSSEIPDNYLDFVYIDGDHSLEGIFYDIYAWTPKVRTGGIVAGHDYKDGPKSGMFDYWGKHLDFHVKTVVDYYGDRYGYKINPIGGRILSWWFVKA
jgi:hypothetical protein